MFFETSTCPKWTLWSLGMGSSYGVDYRTLGWMYFLDSRGGLGVGLAFNKTPK